MTWSITPTPTQVTALPQQLAFVFGHLPEKRPQTNCHPCENIISVVFISATFTAFCTKL